MINYWRHTTVSSRNYLRNLNLFQPPIGSNAREDEQCHFNIIVTRIYLVVLTVLLIALGLFIWSQFETIPVTIDNPHEEELDDLPLDADCPCSRISFSYGDFITLKPILHQVCDSEFVFDRWIKALFSDSNATYYYFKDFRTFGSAQFQALAAFCRLSESYLEQSINSFEKSTFISSKSLSKTNFEREINSSIHQFRETVPRTFATQLELIRRITTSNRLISGLQTSHIFKQGYGEVFTEPVTYHREDGTYCSCSLDFRCTSDAVFNSIFDAPTQYDYVSHNNTPLRGIKSGCLPVNSVLASTLECFYNQTCVNHLLLFFPTNENFSAMTVTNRSRFSPYATVQSIVDQLMVEDWIIDVSYQKYYDRCAPLLCTYSKEKRHSLVFVLTKLISLLGSLIFVLRLMTPIIVRFIIKKLNNVQSPAVSFCTLFNQLKASLKKFIVELNRFQSFPCNDRQIRYQRYATRLYILLIVTSLTIFAGYNLVNISVQRRTIRNPSEVEYRDLEETYSNGLTCSCTSISISYSSFMTIQAHYHQLCSSYLITSRWIDYSNSEVNSAWYVLDYRSYAGSQFQTLAMLCEQARTTIDHALDVFRQTQIINSQVIRQEVFQSKMNSLIESWKNSTISQFQRRMELIRITTSANQLMNRLNIFFQYRSPDRRKIITEPRTYDKCNCASNRTCHDLMAIYTHDGNSNRPVFTLPNFFLGFYLIEALFLSTLECFYNESCMIEHGKYFNSSLIEFLTFPALNANLSLPNETIESMVNRLMVANWSQEVNFTSYYEKCAPSSCVVEYNSRDNLLTIITMIIGIFGGLSIGFHMLIWLELRLIEKFIDGFSFRACLHFMKQLFNCSDEQKLKNRLHTILVIVILYVLYIHHAFNPKLITETREKPSLTVYKDLARQHGDSLHCSCSEISIQHDSFLHINATFHPICKRNFFSEVLQIQNPILLLLFYPNITMQFVYAGMAQFQAMWSFCELSQRTVNESLDQLLKSHLVNAELLSSSSLKKYIQETIDEFKLRVPKTLMNTLALTRETTIANKLMTTYGTNWIFAILPKATPGYTAHTIPVNELGCNCGLTSNCGKIVLGLKIGCYVIEVSSQSKLECLYEQECIGMTNTSRPLNNTADPSRFPINSTFEEVFNELMLEKLFPEWSDEDYFLQCAPTLCFWSYLNQSNLVEGITILISLYGGLVIICEFIAAIIVKLLRYRSIRVTPTTN